MLFPAFQCHMWQYSPSTTVSHWSGMSILGDTSVICGDTLDYLIASGNIEWDTFQGMIYRRTQHHDKNEQIIRSVTSLCTIHVHWKTFNLNET